MTVINQEIKILQVTIDFIYSVSYNITRMLYW